jgi:eukaryotic-like serine/threonine-protein kinase
LFWLDFDGNRKLYVKLKPGGSQRMETYVGDYWLVADSSGSCIGVFGVTGNGQITVEKA